MSRASQSLSLPLEALVRMIVASDNAVSGLQAMAAELGGRDGARISELANRLNRGEFVFETPEIEPACIALIQAAATDETSPNGRLPRWALLDDWRTRTRARLRHVLWFCLGYLLVATLLGLALHNATSKFAKEIGVSTDKYALNFLSQPITALGTIHFLYMISICVTSTLAILWAVDGWLRWVASRSVGEDQRRPSLARLVESFWNQVPVVGSTYRAIDLAQMSESIYQSLSAGWTYSQAFRSAAYQSQSSLLRAWLTAGAVRLERGESFEKVMSECPLRANWLRGMSQVLSMPSPATSLVAQWRSVSDEFHRLMIRRGRRMTVIVAPACVLFATAMLLLGWSFAMRLLFSLLRGLMW